MLGLIQVIFTYLFIIIILNFMIKFHHIVIYFMAY